MLPTRETFEKQFERGRSLAVLPVSRLLVENELVFSREVRFYPPGALDFDQLRVVPMLPVNSLRHELIRRTGIGHEAFEGSASIVFATKLDWHMFYRADYDYDLALLTRLTEEAEKVLDVIRFLKCRLDLPDTLPGKAGTWTSSGMFSGALIYNPVDCESYLLGGAVHTHIIAKGVGLEIDQGDLSDVRIGRGRVGKIARQALALYTSALEANSLTSKYLLAMMTLEFLADPDGYSKFDDVKKTIARHIAGNQSEYLELLRRFDMLGNRGVDGKKGYRHRIVHLGERLEHIVPSVEDRQRLFYQLGLYVSTVIWDMLKRSTQSWEDFVAYRESLKSRLGI